MRHYVTLEIDGQNVSVVDPDDENFQYRSRWSRESFERIAALLKKNVTMATLADGIGVSEMHLRSKVASAAIKFLIEAERSFKLATALKVSENNLREFFREINVDLREVTLDIEIQREKPQKVSNRKKTYDPTSFLGEQNRLVDVKVASQLSGLGQSTIWAWVKANKFPAPIKLSATCVRWKQSDIHSWIKTQAEKLRGLK